MAKKFDKNTYSPSRIVGSNIEDLNANSEIDISEDILYLPEADLLTILLKDRTTNKNIIWATDNYIQYGDGYSFSDEITPEKITGEMNLIIQPRIAKDKNIATNRTKEKAEVFTPSWICKKMNDCIDDAWFGMYIDYNDENDNKDASNNTQNDINTSDVAKNETTENNIEHVFDTPYNQKISFNNLEDKNWQDYVLEDRLEITCGEAPYLVSRYDAAQGNPISIDERYGILDRKLRIVSENTENISEWLEWAKNAYKHTYGYEWQGDSILLARENMLADVIDHFHHKFGTDVEIPFDDLLDIADIISWNIWQMDGLKFVIPGSCDMYQMNHDGDKESDDNICSDNKKENTELEDEKTEQFSLFGESLFGFDNEANIGEKLENKNLLEKDPSNIQDSAIDTNDDVEIENKEIRPVCTGCEKNKKLEHIGIYTKIMDWQENKVVRFVDLLES